MSCGGVPYVPPDPVGTEVPAGPFTSDEPTHA